MSQGPLCPNLTKKVQKKVSQMANRKLSCAMLYRWFKCKLKPPKKGSSDPFRDSLTRRIFDTAKQNSFTIQCVWVQGRQNGKADGLSRKMTDFNPRLEWCIPQKDFNTYMNILGLEPDIDLFASHLTFKVDRYCSRMSDPHSFCIDAFTLNWSQFKQPYIFPPFRILSTILKKIQDDDVRNAIVVAPLHPSQAWFPKFMSMCRTPPLLLPKGLARKLYLPWNEKEKHPLSQHLRLILGRLQIFTQQEHTPRRSTPHFGQWMVP